MGVFDRSVLTLYALALLVVSLAMVLVALGGNRPLDALIQGVRLPGGRVTLGIVSSLLFLASARFLYFGFRREPAQALVRDTTMGQVKISLVAVKNLVARVAWKTPGVRDVKAYVRPGTHGIQVLLVLRVAVDVNLPELCDKLQKAVSSYVRDVVGVAVENVRVTVSDVAHESR
ncbi:MAG TPA: alkaline shock response membrane anchor protein AmaP [Firmicutes bacterium]|nr:alkaline shock response membrane anchor protein AmaP [Candidatus Fermentithermobacillaceae bacterium]